MGNHFTVFFDMISSGRTFLDKAKLLADLPLNFIIRNINHRDPKYDLNKLRFGAVTLKDMFNRKKKVYFHFDLFMLTNHHFSKEFMKILEDKKYSTLLDIGSNVGIAGWYFLMQDSSRKCIFVEPNSNVINIAKDFKNKNQDMFPNECVFVNAGLGSRCRMAFLSYTGVNDISATLRDIKIHTIKHDKKIKVAVDTLDNMIKTHDIKKIDLIKIDVEGYEVEVIKGGRKFFKSIDKVDMIVEIWDDDNLDRFVKVLKSYNLKFTYRPIDYGNWDIKDYLFQIRKR
jgi:FkbM family methyltransferase